MGRMGEFIPLSCKGRRIFCVYCLIFLLIFDDFDFSSFLAFSSLLDSDFSCSGYLMAKIYDSIMNNDDKGALGNRNEVLIDVLFS